MCIRVVYSHSDEFLCFTCMIVFSQQFNFYLNSDFTPSGGAPLIGGNYKAKKKQYSPNATQITVILFRQMLVDN